MELINEAIIIDLCDFYFSSTHSFSGGLEDATIFEVVQTDFYLISGVGGRVEPAAGGIVVTAECDPYFSDGSLRLLVVFISLFVSSSPTPRTICRCRIECDTLS